MKPNSSTFYLPIHGVKKERRSSTKLRVVFDASAKSSNGVSLNDTLLPGPSLYPLLMKVLIHFRQHNFGLTADISKMFSLNPPDCDFHRYLQEDQGSLVDY